MGYPYFVVTAIPKLTSARMGERVRGVPLESAERVGAVV